MIRRVICDTNVFYDIAQGVIKLEWFNGENLTATTFTALEFGKTYKTIAKLTEVRAAFEALKTHCSSVIMDDPYDFATARLIPGYQFNKQKWIPAWDSIELLRTHNFISNPINDQMARRIIDAYEKPFRSGIDALNNGQKKKVPAKQKAEFIAKDFTYKARQCLFQEG